MRLLRRLAPLLIPVQVCILIACIPLALALIILVVLLSLLDRMRGV